MQNYDEERRQRDNRMVLIVVLLTFALSVGGCFLGAIASLV